MKKILFAFATILLAIVPNHQVFAAGLCDVSREAAKIASQIRGLRLKHEVPCSVESKDEVRRYLLHAIATKLPEGRLKQEEITYQALGMIPPDYDYKEGLLKLLTSQLAGYYDPEKDRYVMANWIPASMQTAIAVHEMTHALQDQYFELDDILNHDKFSSDELMARSAYIEGDATAVMSDYSRSLMGAPSVTNSDSVKSEIAMSVLSFNMLAGLEDIPYSLKTLVTFPYTSGFGFTHSLLREGGYKAIDKGFKRFPRSTEEILHPEKYRSEQADFQKLKPAQHPDAPKDTPPLYTDSWGEFGTSSLLSSYFKDKTRASEAASGWGGDTIALYEHNGSHFVTWVTAWDTAEDASEFVKTYQESLRGRLPGSIRNATLNKKLTLSDKSSMFIKIEGVQVTIYWSK